MQKLTFVVAMLFSCGAYADDLSDANRLLEAQSYTQALSLYNKLASAGNAEAQFHLGEMYLYGEGVTSDVSAAKEWFQKSSASGNKQADAALDLIRQRAARRADIDFYARDYKGADISLSKFNCVEPVVPEMSQTKRQIIAVQEGLDAWSACYNGFVKNLNASLPPGKNIPSDIERLMNEQEFTQAKALMEKAYTAVSAEANQKATRVEAKRVAWQAKTEAYVLAESAKKAVDTAAFDSDSRRPSSKMPAERRPPVVVAAPGGSR
ncbi:tetratricopeptide repeat protein [Janthinobacterium rivuli]|uniref:tetratricopeptide repeat protein n=1 Tax=Janthinobacterium rivuli TaxID=2751478 RepID=UPI00383BD66D